MKIKAVYIVLFLFYTFCFLFPSDIVIDYLDGILEIKEGKQWVELYEDDEIEVESTIRLSEDGIVELSGEDIKLTLVKPGIYNLYEIVAESEEIGGYDLDTIISKTLVSFVTGEYEDDKREASFGARALAAKEVEINYIGDEYVSLFYEKGRKLVDEEKYSEAIEKFEEALDYVNLEKEHIFYFYMAYCYYQIGKYGPAIAYLSDINIEPYMPFYSDFIVLYGKLLVQSQAYQDALILLSDFIKNDKTEDKDIVQSVLFLSAICEINLGKKDSALINLIMAKEINIDSDIGIKAKKLIKNLNM